MMKAVVLGSVDSDVGGVGPFSLVLCDRGEEGAGCAGVAVVRCDRGLLLRRGRCYCVCLVVVAGGWGWGVESVRLVVGAF